MNKSIKVPFVITKRKDTSKELSTNEEEDQP